MGRPYWKMPDTVIKMVFVIVEPTSVGDEMGTDEPV
jgi:hypothetical protein